MYVNGVDLTALIMCRVPSLLVSVLSMVNEIYLFRSLCRVSVMFFTVFSCYKLSISFIEPSMTLPPYLTGVLQLVSAFLCDDVVSLMHVLLLFVSLPG